MFKKMIKGLVIGGAALTMAATAAQADVIELNLFGASAQYKFWTEAAPGFLEDQGCPVEDIHSAEGEVDGRDAGFSICIGADGYQGVAATATTPSTDTMIMRYATNASYDGIQAVTGTWTSTTETPECGTSNLNQRKQAVVGHPSITSGSVSATAYMAVHIGASDVAASTFGQSSYGDLYGHRGGDYTTREIGGYADPELMGFTKARPVVVPFAFYANNDVPFDNITREMAVSLYAGQIKDWNEFDTTLASKKVVLCLRHAGSGTHATLDANVMRGDAGLVQTQVKPTDGAFLFGFSPVTWFNKGSSDELKCVAQNAGAIGYADSDKCDPDCLAQATDGTAVEDTTFGGYVKRLTFQGVPANKAQIVDGQYGFWSAQWLYYAATGDLVDLIEDLDTYASNPANLPVKKAPYWAADSEMHFTKSTDFSMPQKK